MSAAPGLVTVYPTLSPTGLLAPRRAAGEFPFGEDGFALTHLGRGAVWLALHSLGIGKGTTVAMPAYHCGSEVEAARLTGASILFYRVDGDLRVDEDDLHRVAAGADAVYLNSHFGFPFARAPEGVTVIEDAAHGLFSAAPDGTPLGSRGDAAIFCPRKSLGTPDGGGVLVRKPGGGSPGGGSPGRGGGALRPEGRPSGKAMARSTASLLATHGALSRSGPVRAAAMRALGGASRADAAAREGTLTETVIGEEWALEVADLDAAASRPARLTSWLAHRVDPARMRERRRANYLSLLEPFADLAPEPYRELPDGTVPLYLPVRTADRDATARRLLEHGVRTIEVWPVAHPLLDRERHAELRPAWEGLLALPVHQDMEPRHVEAVIAAGKAALR